MQMNQLELKKPTVLMGDGALLLMLSLNFVLLAFFILLNSIATRENGHASKVLASVREGYDVKGAVDGPYKGLPWMARDRWQRDVEGQLQGLVLNRLNLQTVPLEVDAERLIMNLPRGAFFSGGAFIGKEMVDNIITAAGKNADLRWVIVGDLRNDRGIAAEMVQLMGVTGRAEAAVGTPALRVIFTAHDDTNPDSGAKVQRLGGEAGATTLQGEQDVLH